MCFVSDTICDFMAISKPAVPDLHISHYHLQTNVGDDGDQRFPLSDTTGNCQLCKFIYYLAILRA